MKQPKKASLAALVLFGIANVFSGGCIDGYAGTGAGMKAAAPFSKSPEAGAALYAIGEATSVTGSYKAAERAGAASATNVYVGGNGASNANDESEQERVQAYVQRRKEEKEAEAERVKNYVQRRKEEKEAEEERVRDYVQRRKLEKEAEAAALKQKSQQ